jgi:serine/threonine protein kinase
MPPERTPSPTDLDPAELLPELEIVRPLGSGSTADVHLARETALERLVALKILRGEAAADEVARRRFEREARSAARISHPNVISIHRVGRLRRGIPYIVMEYVDGRTLRDLIDTAGGLGGGEAQTLLAAVASGLAAAHERGIVHRDLRPGNVYVENRSGRAVLGDFGIAALLEDGAPTGSRLTATGVRLGDTRYLSPEQLTGEMASEQSDVYAFGVLAYETLTGRGPYDAATEAQMMVAHVSHDPIPLATLRPGIDAGLAALVEHCLAKDPNRRPRARELAARLAAPAGSAGRDADRPPEGKLGQFLEEVRRRRVGRVLVAYGAFAAAVLGATGVISDAFDLPRRLYQALVVLILAGLPTALVLAWLYDITAGRIERTTSAGNSERLRPLKWAALVASVICAGFLAWILLRAG